MVAPLASESRTYLTSGRFTRIVLLQLAIFTVLRIWISASRLSRNDLLKTHLFSSNQPQTYKIPEDIKEVPESITNEILACERTGKNYRIQKAELKFYKKMNLPIPRLHPDERHKDRMKLRNPRKLWKRTCGDCNCEIQTTFAPERPEKILCEECYLKVVD